MIITQISQYEVRYSANTFSPSISLKNGSNYIGQLYFKPDGSALPADSTLNGLPALYYHLEDFDNVIDILRNEKPAYLFFNGSGSENGIMTGEIQVGNITGTVSDATTNKPIAGATVIVGSDSTITGNDGKYTLSNILVGPQNITATANGYTPTTQSAAVAAHGTITVNFNLSLQVCHAGTPHICTGPTPKPPCTGPTPIPVCTAGKPDTGCPAGHICGGPTPI